ncbi:molybdopterin-dependent oxidoreductase [Deefgea rivuli]|uniref:molybdopterin-dependent oxidoreductase n=1 Tax=Deefgea rivuli TaxID=400948 RepID=UPI000484A24D|nr:molybdopterin-dependent oxidoreductase [Deefgea rivuli]
MLRILLLSLCLLSPLVHAETMNDKIILTVNGKSPVTEVQLTEAMLAKMPQKSMTLNTPWYPTQQTFEGPLLRDVLKLANIKSGNITLKALNDYAISIPVGDALQYDVIVARLLNGKPMSVREKGPLFIVYPFHEHEELRKTDYYRRCSWQLRSITAE